MKEKYENEREIRLKELELTKQELELKAKVLFFINVCISLHI